jgi:hypothetical protein
MSGWQSGEEPLAPARKATFHPLSAIRPVIALRGICLGFCRQFAARNPAATLSRQSQVPRADAIATPAISQTRHCFHRHALSRPSSSSLRRVRRSGSSPQLPWNMPPPSNNRRWLRQIALVPSTGHLQATRISWCLLMSPSSPLIRLMRQKDQRNDIEDTCLRRLSEVLPPGCRVSILADRGFGDHKLFAYLADLGFGYVIRLRGNIHVADASGETRTAANWA